LIILGISDHFNSGAAVIVDGRVVAAVNEERLARMKMVMGFPRRSIETVLSIAGVAPSEVDHVAVASRWGHFLPDYVDFSDGVFGVDEGAVKNLFFRLGSRASAMRSKLPFLEPLYYQLRQPVYWNRRRGIGALLRKDFGITCPVEYVWHHFAHAACAYYASGFQDTLVVTLDGSGDGHSSHVYEVTNGKWKFLHAVPSFDGVGNYYGYVTQLSGFKAGKHEGKITGLAAYGKDAYLDVLKRFICYQQGTMTNVGNAFRWRALSEIKKSLPEHFSREDLAASIQTLTEQICVDYASYWLRRTGKRNLALAGGVVANVKVNQRLHEIPDVDQIFVYPAMSDEGLSAGAALIVAEEKGRASQGRCFDHVYLGPAFSDSEIRSCLGRRGIEAQHFEDPSEEIARLIADGYVVARFDGRMEYGPRALGNRSILYRPDDPSANDWLNKRLRRTEFMPFAPATAIEDANACYEGLTGAEDTARFMTITFDCTDAMKRMAPGVVHVDGTARPQLVSREDNPSYYRVIREFKRLTGISSIVNTSFNIHEEPIVCTPEDAIRAFEQGHLDVLAIGGFVVKNQEADQRVASAAAQRS
jgi:carbamoyltransferase